MLINERPEGDRNPPFDNEASLKEAESRFPLERVLEQFGCNPINGSWKKVVCPFCQKKTSAGTFQSTDGQTLFKCHSTSCKSGTQAMGPIQFIAAISSMSQRDAFISYLKMSGVWKDREKFKGLPKQGSETAAPGNGAPKAAGDGRDGGPGPQATSLQGDAQVGSGNGTEKSEPTKEEAKSASEIPAEGAEGKAQGATADSGSGGVPGPAPIPPAPALQSTSENVPAQDAALAGASKAEAASSKLHGPEAPTGPVKSPAPAPVKGGPFMTTEPDGWRALREFFTRLTLTNADRDALFNKRGLKWLSSHALRLRSNPKTNEIILRELYDKYGPREMLASGLWLPEDRKNRKVKRPNSQFFGFGVKGKKKQDDEDGQDSVGDFVWGWTYPILIPYFDDTGELIGLRPHKGMGRSGTLVGTPQLYIPRGAGGPKDGAAETFYTVVITEGEFKAGALWQSLGVWRTDGKEPVGVAAIPGISFGRNYEIREVLEDWLRKVRCREVIVVFDNEEKRDPSLEAYKADRRKRFEAQKWARFLAASLATKLHIFGKVGMLPNSWRNSKGKADWDGAAAEMVAGSVLEVAK